jgi:hypothetical protein
MRRNAVETETIFVRPRIWVVLDDNALRTAKPVTLLLPGVANTYRDEKFRPFEELSREKARRFVVDADEPGPLIERFLFIGLERF